MKRITIHAAVLAVMLIACKRDSPAADTSALPTAGTQGGEPAGPTPDEAASQPAAPDCAGLTLEPESLGAVAPMGVHLPKGGYLFTVKIHNRADAIAHMPPNDQVAVITATGEQLVVDSVPTVESWFHSFDIEPGAFRRVALLLPGELAAAIASVRVHDIELGNVTCTLRQDGLAVTVPEPAPAPEPPSEPEPAPE